VRVCASLSLSVSVYGRVSYWMVGSTAILARTEYLLAHHDLDGATRQLNQLRGWQRRLAQDWLTQARSALEVRQMLDVVLSEVSYAMLWPAVIAQSPPRS
jgi:hypothetical protein